MLKKTAEPTTTIYDFQLALDALRHAMTALTDAIRDCDVADAQVFTLPPVTKAQELERRKEQINARRNGDVLLDPPITVTPHHGDDALRVAMRHWPQFYAPHENSTRLVQRTPGIVFVQTDQPEQLMQLVTQVNAHKNEVVRVTQGLADSPEQRHELIHQVEPGFILVAATRQFPVFAPHHDDWLAPLSLNSVSFIWEHRYRSTRMSRNDVIAEIEKSLNADGPQTSFFYGAHPEGFKFFLEQELAIMTAYPKDAQFIVRRPLPVLPVCMIRFKLDHDSRSQVRNIVGHSPILAINAPTPRKMMPLKDYLGRSTQPAPHSKLVLERLYLYEAQ
jgi:DNA replication terminus site-binding protein